MRKLIGHEPNIPKLLANLNHPMPVFDGIQVVNKDLILPNPNIMDVWKRWREKIKLNNEFGPIGRPDGDIRFDAPLFDIQHIGRALRQPVGGEFIRMLPTWNLDKIKNGSVINPAFPALRLKQLKSRDNGGLAIKGKDFVFDKRGQLIPRACDIAKSGVYKIKRKAKQEGLKQLQGFWKAAQGPKGGDWLWSPSPQGFLCCCARWAQSRVAYADGTNRTCPTS